MTNLPTSIDKGLGDLGHTGWNLLAEEISLPCAVLYDTKIEGNLRWMQGFVDAYGLKLAPHGKTTMAPQLFRRQISAGAWGITMATAQQVRAAAAGGIKRILMANQLVGRRNMQIVSDVIAGGVEFYCLVDSIENVRQLGAFFATPLNILIELAPAPDQSGFRTGVRTDEALAGLLDEIARWPNLRLCGIEIYEGVLSDEAEIRTFLRRAVTTLGALSFAIEKPILSGAGSAWYDVVAEEFAAADAEVILRPGCYLTHDVGAYQASQARIEANNTIAAQMRSGLQPALHLWACVQSVPDERRAVIGLGKRDSAFDAGFPEPALWFRPGAKKPSPPPQDWMVTGMMDQHAFLEIAPGDDIQPGDMIAFDIRHPCLTFDKWRHLLLLDDDYRCIDIITTAF